MAHDQLHLAERIRKVNQGLDKLLEVAVKNSGQEIKVYEDELPPLSDAEYALWFAGSDIINGVRMGPLTDRIKHNATLEIAAKACLAGRHKWSTREARDAVYACADAIRALKS